MTWEILNAAGSGFFHPLGCQIYGPGHVSVRIGGSWWWATQVEPVEAANV